MWDAAREDEEESALMRDQALNAETAAVCVLDDELEVCLSLAELFRSEGIACAVTASPAEAGEWLLARSAIRVLVTDIRMPEMNGLDLLRSVGRARPDLAVIVMTGYPSVENAVTAMKLGAADFIPKPVDFPSLLEEVRRLLNAAPDSAAGQDNIVTGDSAFLQVIRHLDIAAATDVPVVLLGESGTGKELLARRLHRMSPRRGAAYVCVNCAALPEPILESELFGHEKGAFTGAGATRRGRFEIADGGTMFLDEIGDMPLGIQAKILRAVEYGQFDRVGGETGMSADVRFVAATNRDLGALVSAGGFREDLYYRLSVVALDIPPLRERPDDITLLAGHFIGLFNRMYGKRISGLSAGARDLLMAHSWPGNVRELRNCVQRAVIFRAEGEIEAGDLPGQYRAGEQADPSRRASGNARESRRETLRDLDRELIKRTLAECDGVKSLAAERLRIHRKTLYNRMKTLGLGD